ncbi:MAG: hypothetical protein VX730_04470 [Pseudomonadota bacterium]|nr:hypothetical protein [Pseudomonadota bacterium]
MQVIYIMGVFMFVFSIVMGLTTTLTRSAMQNKLDSIAQVESMFLDIERGTNNGILANQADLRYLHNHFRNGVSNEFSQNATTRAARDGFNAALLDYVNWSEDQLRTDPWGTPMRVYYSTSYRFLDAGVQAPITTFAYISAGPNKGFEASSTLATVNTNNITAMEVSAGSDDILYVFSTYDAMARTWNILTKAVDGVIGLIQTDYSDQYAEFLPQIETYNAGRFAADPTFGFDNASLNEWLTAPSLTGLAGYPTLPDGTAGVAAVGGSVYFNGAPLFNITPPANVVTINRTNAFTAQVGINLSAAGAPALIGWNINYMRTIDGRSIVSN